MKFKLRWLWAAHYQQDVPQWTRDFCNWGPRRFLRDIRWTIQQFLGDYLYRLPFKGYRSKDLWSIDYAMFKWVLPRLRAFKKNLRGIPGWCFSEEHYSHVGTGECEELKKEYVECPFCKLDWEIAENKWVGIIDDMIFALQNYVDGNWDGPDGAGFWNKSRSKWEGDSPENLQAERGYKYFIEHMFSLWD